MLFKKLAFVGLAAGALALGGCTNTQEQQVLAAAQNTCLQVGPGGAIFASIVSSLDPSLAPVASLAAALTNDISNQCPAFVASLQGVIEDINALGGTATVNVTTNSASGVKHHFRVKISRSTVYVVPPASLF